MDTRPQSDRSQEAPLPANLTVNTVDVVDLMKDVRKLTEGAFKSLGREAESMLGAFAMVDKGKPEKKADNVWSAESTDEKKGVDRLKLKAVQSVSVEQFKRDNPGVDPDKLDPDKTYNYNTYQSKLDPGWKVDGKNKDGTMRLTKDMTLSVNHKDDHSGLIETVKDVSDEHRKAVEDKLKEIPKGVLNTLEAAGYKILVAPSVVEALPELRGQTYRGWTANFEHSDGTQDAEKRVIVAPEKVKEGKEWEKVSRPEVLTHQVGHALDAVGKQTKGQYYSQSKEFQEAYQRDLARMSPEDTRSDIGKYLRQPDGGGSRETFASLFGLVTTGTENPGDRKAMERMFPATTKYMKALVDGLK